MRNDGQPLTISPVAGMRSYNRTIFRSQSSHLDARAGIEFIGQKFFYGRSCGSWIERQPDAENSEDDDRRRKCEEASHRVSFHALSPILAIRGKSVFRVAAAGPDSISRSPASIFSIQMGHGPELENKFPVDEDGLGNGLGPKRVAAQNQDIGVLSGLETSDSIGDAGQSSPHRSSRLAGRLLRAFRSS